MGISIEDIVAPGLGMITGKGFLGDVLGKKSKREAEQAALAKTAADEKAAQEQATAQASAQQWANSRSGMKKGGAVKKMNDGGPVYTEKMGKPPQDVDGKSAGKVDKKDTPEQPGSGIRVDGKPLKRANGGSVSASRRADGIASKGKTRGKMC
jgi:hypothetical protein